MIQQDHTMQVENGMTQEKRACHRRRVLKGATVRFNKGYGSYGCRVRNLTEGGALLEMGETTGLPHHFEFQLDGAPSVPAEIVWRTAQKIGIKYSAS